MLTSLYALEKAPNAWLWFILWQGCMILYALLMLMPRCNRTPAGLGRGIVSFLILSGLFDLVWFICFFPSAKYESPGTSGAYLLAAYPTALLLLGCVVTICNRRHR